MGETGWDMLYIRVPSEWKKEIKHRVNGDGGISRWVRNAIAEQLEILPPATMDDILATYQTVHAQLNDQIRQTNVDDIHNVIEWMREETRLTTQRDPTYEDTELFVLRRYAHMSKE